MKKSLLINRFMWNKTKSKNIFANVAYNFLVVKKF